jgi:hypothetical protein
VNAEPSEPALHQDDEELVEALVKRCKLSHEDVANIHESMQTMGARFADARFISDWLYPAILSTLPQTW